MHIEGLMSGSNRIEFLIVSLFVSFPRINSTILGRKHTPLVFAEYLHMVWVCPFFCPSFRYSFEQV